MILVRDPSTLSSTEAETIVNHCRKGPCNSMCIRGRQYRATEVRHSRLSWSARVLGEILDTTPAYLAMVESNGSIFAVVAVEEERTYVVAYTTSGGELRFDTVIGTSLLNAAGNFNKIYPSAKLLKVYTAGMATELSEKLKAAAREP